MKGARRDKQNMVCFHHPIFCRYSATLNQWQQITLHSLTRHIRSPGFRTIGHFVDFVYEYNTILFNTLYRLRFQFFLIN